MSKLQYSIKLYDKNQNQTHEQKLFVEENADYIEVMEQLISYLKDFRLEIDPFNIGLILGVGKNPRETFCLLERVN